MKLSILSIFGILLLCHSLEAQPAWSWIHGVGDKLKNFADKIKQKYIDLKNKIENFEKNARESVKKSIDRARNEIVSFYNDARTKMSSSAEKVESFIKKIPDLTTQEIYKQVKLILEKANEQLEKLMETTDKNFEKAKETLNNQVFDVKSQIQTFTKKMNEKLSNKKQAEEGSEILDNFVKESTEIVSSCSEQAIEPLQAVYDDIKERIKEILQTTNELVDSLGECVNNAGIKRETYDCAKNIRGNVQSSFQEIVSTITGLSATFTTKGVDGLFAGGCMAKTRLEVELKKSSVQKQINNLK